jgi:hypothetical protein
MQGLRAILPAGEIWTPIFDRKLCRTRLLSHFVLDSRNNTLPSN